MSYSQLGQDIWVLENAKHKYFVDVGASDPIKENNTKLLEEQGWKGICVEPGLSYIDLKEQRTAIVENLCVYSITGKYVPFMFEARRNLSGIPEFFDNYHKRTGEIKQIITISLFDLLKKHSAPQHMGYLSIDTEGSEFCILEAFDFSYKFDCITVEHNYEEFKKIQIRNLLEAKGYKLKKEKDIEDWYVFESKLFI